MNYESSLFQTIVANRPLSNHAESAQYVTTPSPHVVHVTAYFVRIKSTDINPIWE